MEHIPPWLLILLAAGTALTNIGASWGLTAAATREHAREIKELSEEIKELKKAVQQAATLDPLVAERLNKLEESRDYEAARRHDMDRIYNERFGDLAKMIIAAGERDADRHAQNRERLAKLER